MDLEDLLLAVCVLAGHTVVEVRATGKDEAFDSSAFFLLDAATLLTLIYSNSNNWLLLSLRQIVEALRLIRGSNSSIIALGGSATPPTAPCSPSLSESSSVILTKYSHESLRSGIGVHFSSAFISCLRINDSSRSASSASEFNFCNSIESTFTLTKHSSDVGIGAGIVGIGGEGKSIESLQTLSGKCGLNSSNTLFRFELHCSELPLGITRDLLITEFRLTEKLRSVPPYLMYRIEINGELRIHLISSDYVDVFHVFHVFHGHDQYSRRFSGKHFRIEFYSIRDRDVEAQALVDIFHPQPL
uniref:Uncharacterized protein n=1 Tax=Glossina pallidipes TaxID=7398 RepID=A0A1B0A0X5_GLOPL